MNKIKLYKICCDEITMRIELIKVALNEVQEAANNETKSSAGDKHETGRAMAQLETEKLTSQLAKLLTQQNTLNKINVDKTHKIVGLGSLVKTNNGLFFLSIPLGKLKFDNYYCYTLSSTSPIAKLLISKKVGDSFSFNGINYKIEIIQ